MNTRIILIITVVTLIVINLFLTFVKSSSLMEFGLFFNAFMMPILTAINIFVFVRLTNSISEKDTVQSEKELSFQKQLLLIQFQKAEIETFEKTMYNVFSIKSISDYKEYVNENSFSVLNAIYYLDSFIKTKLTLFDLNKESKISNDITDLGSLLGEYYDDVQKNGIPSKEAMEVYSKMFSLKNSIIHSLQKVILNCENK